jgi:NAD(P)-dependent dehydrogenase (short-subunit alcohol dehydrogenase family)
MASSKVVIVTGGNAGIGYEAVKALFQSTKPYHVLMGSRSLEKGKLAAEMIKRECPEAKNSLEPIQLDVTSDESIKNIFSHVQSSQGRLDVLVHNAGKPSFVLATFQDT